MQRLWKDLTEPAQALEGAQERRQSRLMSSVLVVLLPGYVAMAAVAAATRHTPVSFSDLALAALFFGLALGAYLLNRTVHFRRGAVLLSALAIGASVLVSLREPDAARAPETLLLGMTGVIYASIMLPAWQCGVAAGIDLLLTFAVALFHPWVAPGHFVIAVALACFVVALTVVAAVLRERHEAELEAGTRRLWAMADSAPDAAVLVDGAFVVQQWGRQGESLFGVPIREAVGQPLRALVLHPSAPEFHPLLRSLRGGAVQRLEFEACTRAGRTFSCEASVGPAPGGGAVVFLRDVSERKRLEGRLMLSDRLETMGRMVAGVAHEVNNPLTFVLGNLHELEALAAAGHPEPKLLAELAHDTLDGARRIQAIVRDLKSLSRNSSEHEALVEVDVERSIDSTLVIARGSLTRAGATLTRNYGGVGAVRAVESKLGQVFLNLLINAAQALDEHSARREIIVTTRAEGGRVVVSVQDFGGGMTAEVRERLFAPFFTTKAPGKGTGLGLYLSHTIVTAMGGEFKVTSAPGQGTTFDVVLPRGG